MALEQNLSSIININKDTLVDAAKNFNTSQKSKLVASLKSAITENIKKSEKDIKDLEIQYIKSENNYKIQNNKIESLEITDAEKQEKLKQLKKDYEAEKILINNNIESKKNELLNKSKSYILQEVESLKSEIRLASDTTYAKTNDIKNGKKVNMSSKSIITTVGVISNLLISSITIGNKKIEKIVDRVNEQIKNIQTEQDIQKCKLLVNRAKLIINQNRIKLQTIQTVIIVFQVLIPLLDVILNLFKLNPIPSAVPPGVGIPLGTINTIDSKTKTLDDLKLAAIILSSIISQVINKMINDLEYHENRLLPIENLLNLGISNLTPGQIPNMSSDLSFNLGYLNGYDYKEFKFFIKEEINPDFIVKGNKRRYATAVNKDGNDILKSSLSFTLSPDVLIEELKLQIDQKDLIA